MAFLSQPQALLTVQGCSRAFEFHSISIAIRPQPAGGSVRVIERHFFGQGVPSEVEKTLSKIPARLTDIGKTFLALHPNPVDSWTSGQLSKSDRSGIERHGWRPIQVTPVLRQKMRSCGRHSPTSQIPFTEVINVLTVLVIEKAARSDNKLLNAHRRKRNPVLHNHVGKSRNLRSMRSRFIARGIVV